MITPLPTSKVEATEHQPQYVLDPCPQCREIAQIEGRLLNLPIPESAKKLRRTVMRLLQLRSPKGRRPPLPPTAKEVELREELARLEAPRQTLMDRKAAISNRHPHCRGCGMFFGPGHLASLADVKRKYCNFCVHDLEHYGEMAFMGHPGEVKED